MDNLNPTFNVILVFSDELRTVSLVSFISTTDKMDIVLVVSHTIEHQNYAYKCIIFINTEMFTQDYSGFINDISYNF